MLGSPQMKEYIAKLSEIYDFIIVDLPPITVVSDALAISPALHGIVLVVRSSYSRRRELHVTLKSLELAGSKVLGIVINAKKNSLSSGLKYSKYSRRGYYAKSYSGKDEKSE